MAVTLRVLEGNGSWKGTSSSIASYSAGEEATPEYAGDSSGSVGTLEFTVLEDVDSRFLIDATVELNDQSNGTTRGIVTGLNGASGELAMSAQNRMWKLVGLIGVPPYTGTLGAYLRALCAPVAIVPVVDASLENIPIDIRAWEGDRWENLKQLGAIYGFDIAYVSNNTVIRPKRERIAVETQLAMSTWNISKNPEARYVAVTYTNDVYRDEGIVWPKDVMEAEVLQVEAGMTQDYTLETDYSLMSIKQPTIMTFVAKDYSGADSVYTVAGSDGLPVPPALWTEYGGSLTLSISEDTRSIEVKLVGANLEHLSPFTVSVNSGSSEAYSTLRVVGEGIWSDAQTIEVYTGADPNSISSEEGASLEAPGVRTLSQAYDAARGLAATVSSYHVTVEGEARAINRRGDKGIVTYNMLSYYNEYNGAVTLAQFSTANTGKTFAQYSADVQAAIAADAASNSFENQAFGNSAGALVKRPEAVYRIKSATITQGGVSYVAELSTTVEDFDAKYDSMTIAQFNAAHAGKTLSDYNVAPLGI